MCKLTTSLQFFLFRDILYNVITRGAGTAYASVAPGLELFSLCGTFFFYFSIYIMV